ncbi:MAG: MFS transporter [Acidimicrobiales bacterium]
MRRGKHAGGPGEAAASAPPGAVTLPGDPAASMGDASAVADSPATVAPSAQVAAPGRGFSALRPFRHRNYTLLWSGGFISIVGSWMQTVAVGALVASHTGSALWVVVVAAGGFLPTGVLSPIGGALADRLPRRPVLIACNLVAGGVALVIALLVGAHDYGPLLLTMLVTAQGAVSAIMGPFQQAILPDLVPRSEFLAASSLNSAQWNLGRVVGPALAGATVLAFGYPMAFLANAVSFLAVVAALMFVRLAPPPGRDDPTTLAASLRAGFRAARAEPGCWAAIVLIAVVAVLGSPFIALVPAVAHRLTGLGHAHSTARAVASATAVLTTAQGVGAVVGALLMAPLAERLGRGRVLVGALILLIPVLVAYDLAPALSWATAALFAVGLVYIWVLSGLQTVVQLRAPTRFRGRILSIYLVALGVAYPIGSLLQGPIADRLGLPATTTAAALVLAVALLAIRLSRPALFHDLTAEVR